MYSSQSFLGPGELEPVEAVAGHGQQVGPFTNAREVHTSGQLHRGDTFITTEVELDRLCEAGQVVHAEHDAVAELPHEGQHAGVGRAELFVAALAEGRMPTPDGEQPTGPVQQRVVAAHLGFDVQRLVAVDRVHDHR